MHQFVLVTTAFAIATAAAAFLLGLINYIRNREWSLIPALALLASSISFSILSSLTIAQGFSDRIILLRLGSSELSLFLDPMSAAFILFTSIVWFGATIYSVPYFKLIKKPFFRYHWVFFPVAFISLMLMYLSESPIAFAAFLDILTISMAALIMLERTSTKSVKVAKTYAILMVLASSLVLISFIALAAEGVHVSFSGIAGSMVPEGYTVFLIPAFIGFLLKAGALPLHSWIPRVYSEAPFPIAAVLAGSVLNTGIYGLIRTSIMIESPDPYLGLVFYIVGFASIVYGSLMAMVQTDMKKAITYSSVVSTGYVLLILAGIAWATKSNTGSLSTSLITAILYVFSASVAKASLFMSLGNVVLRMGMRSLRKLGGLKELMPYTFWITVMSSLALIGLPPFLTFHAKTLMLSSVLGHGFLITVQEVTVLTLSTALTSAYLFRIIYRVFIHESKYAVMRESISKFRRDVPTALLIPPTIGLAVLVVLSVFSQYIRALGEYIAPSISPMLAVYPLVTVYKGWGLVEEPLMLAVPTAILVPAATAAAFWLWEHAEILSHGFNGIYSSLWRWSRAKKVILWGEKLIEYVQELDEDERIFIFLSAFVAMLMIFFGLGGRP